MKPWRKKKSSHRANSQKSSHKMIECIARTIAASDPCRVNSYRSNYTPYSVVRYWVIRYRDNQTWNWRLWHHPNMMWYCSAKCQSDDYDRHKIACKAMVSKFGLLSLRTNDLKKKWIWTRSRRQQWWRNLNPVQMCNRVYFSSCIYNTFLLIYNVCIGRSQNWRWNSARAWSIVIDRICSLN